MAVCALLVQQAEAVSHRVTKHKVRKLSNQLIQVNLDDNTKLLQGLNQKIASITNLVEVKRMEPACDADCKAKWKNLKDTYRRKKTEQPKSGAGAQKPDKWKFRTMLQFLDPFIREGK